MLLRGARLCACLLCFLLIAPSAPQADPPQQILGFALGNTAPVPSQALGVFGLGGLAPAMIEAPRFIEVPSPHYVLKLSQDRTLTIWFDANSSDRPIYWIQLFQNYHPPTNPPPRYEDVLKDIGNIDYKISGTDHAPLGVLLIVFDPALSGERTLRARRHLESVIAARPTEPANDDLFVEVPPGLEYRLKLLGDAFRGKMVHAYFYAWQIDGMGTELIDLPMAKAALEQAQ